MRRLAAIGLLAGLLGACEERAPRYSLREVMFQMEHDRLAIEKRLNSADPAEYLTQAQRIRTFGADPSFERYLQTRAFVGDPAEFRRQQKAFLELADGFLRELEGDSIPPRVQAWNALRASCETCHVGFRPDMR